jgi:hypothetical protein
MKISLTRGEGKPRKTRSDKRVRSTLRLKPRYDELIKAMAYNHPGLTKQRTLDAIIEMVLDSETLRYRLISSFRNKYGQRAAYLNLSE